jgi:hypothetical protein
MRQNRLPFQTNARLAYYLEGTGSGLVRFRAEAEFPGMDTFTAFRSASVHSPEQSAALYDDAMNDIKCETALFRCVLEDMTAVQLPLL